MINQKSIFNFDYPLQEDKDVDLEFKIKQRIRNGSYNKLIERDIKRYSDKYITEITKEELLGQINLEILSPELIEVYRKEGALSSSRGTLREGSLLDRGLLDRGLLDRGGDSLVNTIKLDDNENELSMTEEEADQSLQGDDDYNHYYNDEDELVGEEELEGEL